MFVSHGGNESLLTTIVVRSFVHLGFLIVGSFSLFWHWTSVRPHKYPVGVIIIIIIIKSRCYNDHI